MMSETFHSTMVHSTELGSQGPGSDNQAVMEELGSDKSDREERIRQSNWNETV